MPEGIRGAKLLKQEFHIRRFEIEACFSFHADLE